MEPIPIHTLITHESPDLDAIISVLLIKKFGEPFFPGISNAKLEFYPAGKLPGDKNSAQLEKSGILAVDIGGGRFDTHPVNMEVDWNKRDRAAADLVAEHLGLLEDPSWSGLIEYTRLQDSSGHNMYSRKAHHMMMGLLNILEGLQFIHPFDSEKKLDKGIKIISCIPFYAQEPYRKKTFSDLLTPFIQNYLDSLNFETDNPPSYLKPLLSWFELLKNEDIEVFPRNKLDDLVTLKAILIGAHRMSDGDEAFVESILSLCMEAILTKEKNWVDSLEDVSQNGILKDLGPASILAIRSPNGLTIKAARYLHKASLVVYQNSLNDALSFTLNRLGPLNSKFLKGLTAKIRIAECVLQKTPVNYTDIDKMGSLNGWFLHQSGNILVRGSNKSRDFVPSLLPLELITDISSQQVINFLNLNTPPPKLPKEIEAAFIAYGLSKFSNLF